MSRLLAVLALAAALAACKQESRPAAPEAGVAAPAPSALPAPAEIRGAPASAPDDAAIRRVFASYRAAIERADGARAAALLDRDTVGFYDRMHKAALDMPGDEVRARPLIERLTIVAMRAGRSRAQLTAMTTHEVLAAAIVQGSGTATVQGVELADIVVDGDRASATPRKGGLALPLRFHFRREPEGWRFDLTQLLAGVDQMLKAQLKGMTEDDLIRAYVASVGGVVDETMWEPPP
jgi:ketosteroid isomerase-like protein